MTKNPNLKKMFFFHFFVPLGVQEGLGGMGGGGGENVPTPPPPPKKKKNKKKNNICLMYLLIFGAHALYKLSSSYLK